jgi:hypothetical protein
MPNRLVHSLELGITPLSRRQHKITHLEMQLHCGQVLRPGCIDKRRLGQRGRCYGLLRKPFQTDGHPEAKLVIANSRCLTSNFLFAAFELCPTESDMHFCPGTALDGGFQNATYRPHRSRLSIRNRRALIQTVWYHAGNAHYGPMRPESAKAATTVPFARATAC